MTQLAPHLTTFLREHLPHERRASVHTCDAYSYSFQLLVVFAAQRLGKRPCLLRISEIRDSDFANSRTPVSVIPGQSGQG